MKQFFDKNNNLIAELNYAKDFYDDYAKHSHDTLCISIVKKGKISVEFHNKKIQYIEPNQLVVFNPYQVHVTKNTDVQSYDYYTLHLYKEWTSNISLDIYFGNNIIDDKNRYEEFLDLCEYLIDNQNKSLNNEDKIYSFLNNFINNYANKLNNDQQQNNKILNDIKEYILNNIQEQLTLTDISNEIGYSKEHIIRLFKKEFGLTPHAFLVNAKVNMAKQLLQNSNELNLANIASEAGFYDQSHFTKNFKKLFAISPNSYKK